jgi:hypothetical protein
MSTYSGPQAKGAAAAHRRSKRAEADTRAASYERRVLRYVIDHGVPEDEARKIVRLEGHIARQILAGRIL